MSHRPYESKILPFVDVTVPKVGAWSVPKGTVPEEKTFGREDTLFQVEGLLLESRVILADCDMEFTIGTGLKDRKRIVARLPNNKDYCDLRDKVNQQLKDSCGVDTLWEMKTVDFTHLAHPPRVRVLAYAFFNAVPEPDIVPSSAPAGTKPRPTRKPMWELRPVQDITIHKTNR